MKLEKNNKEKKPNRAVERSKATIRNAFLELLKENKNQNKDIRIVDIVNKAGLNRGTFYAHYNSIDELEYDATRTVVKELFGYILEIPMSTLTLSPTLYISELVIVISKNRDLLEKIEGTRHIDHLINRINMAFVRKAKNDESIKELRDKVNDPVIFDYIIYLCMNTLVSSIREIVKGEIPINILELPKILGKSIAHIFHFLNKTVDFEDIVNKNKLSLTDEDESGKFRNSFDNEIDDMLKL